MPTIIENFDTITEDDIQSYSDGQDLMPFSWELTNGELHLWGNTWKKQDITPVAISPDTVWQISVYLDNYISTAQTSEMQGFGVIDDQGNKLRYMFGGTTGPSDSLHWGEWVYQGAFPALQWNDYRLPISKDFARKYGYNTTIIETLFYYNDDDPPAAGEELGMGAIWFDDVVDITDDLNQTECPPTIEIEHEELSDGVYQFNAILTHPCENFPLDVFWDFGDGTTSDSFGWIEHTFPADDHDYTVFVKVTDNIGKTDWDSVNVSVPTGPSTFPVTVAWTGDAMFARRFECWDYPICGDPGILAYYDSDYLFEKVKPLLDEADFKIINLETAVTTTAETNVHPQKSIPLRSHPDTLSGLVYADIDYVSLANNHSGDYMVPGLEETIDSIKETGIRFSGAGFNSYDAYIPGFLNMNGVNFSIVSVSDRSSEYCGIACGMPRLNAGFNKLGFAYADIFDMSIVADEVSNVSDLTAVYLHAGPEYNQYPPMDDPSLARSSIDLTNYDQNEFGFVPVQWAEHEDYYPFNGGQVRVANMDERHAMMDHENLDILVAHHPHVLQGVELYNNKLIVHSLGNFIFDGNFPETMESAIFYSTIDLVDGVPTFTEYKFKPIYLDHYITKPAIGELGAHILDRHANLSRNIGSDYRAYLSVNKINLESKVIISDDPANTLRQQYICSWGLSNPVSVEDPWEGGGSSGTHLYQYDLIRLPRHGNISALGGNIPSGQTFFKYRVGREILPMGNMEDEGSDLWMLNSQYEEYSSGEAYRGSRSLKHIRYDEQEGFVLTSFEKRFPIGTFVSSHDAYISWEAKSHSLHGAVKCYNCPPSDPPAFEIIYYQCRNGIPLDYVNEDTYYSETINSELIGDTGWTVIEKELDLQTAEGLMAIPEGNKAFNGMYFNLRIKTWANTGNGDSTVYYDDVGIIEWEDWVVYEDENSLQIQNPNDYKYLQVRTSESASGESIVVEELYYGENLGYSDLDPSPCSGDCSCAYQGEFGGTLRSEGTGRSEEIKQYLIQYQDEWKSFQKTDLSEMTDNIDDSFIYKLGNGHSRVLITAPHSQYHYRHECPNDEPECTYSYQNCSGGGGQDGSCGKLADYCSGPYARILSDITGASVLFTTYKSDDPNYYHHISSNYYQTPIYGDYEENLIPFKQKMSEISDKFDFVLDLHGIESDQIGDIDLGFGEGCYDNYNPSECSLLTDSSKVDIPLLISEVLYNHEIIGCENCVYTGMKSDTVTKFSSLELGIDAVQFEINRPWRCCSSSESYCDPAEDWPKVIQMINAMAEVIDEIDDYYIGTILNCDKIPHQQCPVGTMWKYSNLVNDCECVPSFHYISRYKKN